MATNTTNFNLSKPAYSDTADIAVINSNMDKVDTALQGLGSGLAIISKNNTHDAITAGQYVYVHGHGSLAEGLYTAKSNIAANATLSTSNLQAEGSGGLNALSGKINTKPTVTNVQINSNGSYTYSKISSDNNVSLLVSVGRSSNNAYCGLYLVFLSSSDGNAKAISSSTAATITANNNGSITISNSATYAIWAKVVELG